MGEGILNVLKIIGVLLLLPFVFVFATAFPGHLEVYPYKAKVFFLWGGAVSVGVFLFVTSLRVFHDFGQKLMRGLFAFATPLEDFLSLCFPFYPIIILFIFFLVQTFFHTNTYNDYFLFSVGFTYVLHLMLVARDLQERESGPLRLTYFFKFAVIFLISALVVLLLCDLAFGKWTFFQFWKKAVPQVSQIYQKLFRLLTFR